MKLRLLATALLALPLLAGAQTSDSGTIRILQPWARATVTGQGAGGAFLKIENTGAADRLLSVRSEAAASTELHTMTMEGNIMRMREVDSIELPPGKTVELKPGGLHIMLMGLKAPLKAGEQVPLTLRFEKAGELSLQVPIEAAGSAGAGKAAAPAGHGHHRH